MSYIQLPYGLLKKKKKVKFHLPKNYEETQYIKRLPNIQNKDLHLHFNNSVTDILKNREDLKKISFGDKRVWK